MRSGMATGEDLTGRDMVDLCTETRARPCLERTLWGSTAVMGWQGGDMLGRGVVYFFLSNGQDRFFIRPL